MGIPHEIVIAGDREVQISNPGKVLFPKAGYTKIDLDPVPGVKWTQVRKVGLVVQEVLKEFKLPGYPKTSGKRGLHIYVRIKPRWTYEEVRRCALAFAREVERRAPKLVTTKWWKE